VVSIEDFTEASRPSIRHSISSCCHDPAGSLSHGGARGHVVWHSGRRLSHGGVEEMLDGDPDCLVALRDHQALGRMIQRFSEDDRLRLEKARHQHRIYLARFTLEHFEQRFFEATGLGPNPGQRRRPSGPRVSCSGMRAPRGRHDRFPQRRLVMSPQSHSEMPLRTQGRRAVPSRRPGRGGTPRPTDFRVTLQPKPRGGTGPCRRYEARELEEALAAVLEGSGLGADPARPGLVLIKPNLVAARAAESAVTTHPRSFWRSSAPSVASTPAPPGR